MFPPCQFLGGEAGIGKAFHGTGHEVQARVDTHHYVGIGDLVRRAKECVVIVWNAIRFMMRSLDPSGVVSLVTNSYNWERYVGI